MAVPQYALAKAMQLDEAAACYGFAGHISKMLVSTAERS